MAFLAALFVAVGVAAGRPAVTGVRADEALWPVGPVITSKAAMVIEADTGVVLYKSDAYTAYQPANISQIMTSLIVLERFSLNDIMTMSTKAETSTKGSRVGLVRKESVTVESALYAVLLASGNEVAYGLSEMVSGDRDSFVELMNRRAGELGAVNTHFTSPEGADDPEHYTCAADMALFAREAYKNADFLRITGTARYTIPATNLKEARPIANRHLFVKGDIKYEPAVAGKVGYSSAAGYTGVTYAGKDGMNVICVILGAGSSDTLYAETKQLCNWCFENYKAYNIEENELGANATFASLFDSASRFNVGSPDPIVTFEGSNVVVVPKGVPFSDITRKVSFDGLKEYYHGNNRVGTITYEYGGIFVGSADIIYYNEGYPLNTEVIDERWPAFLFRIDDVFTPEHAALLEQYEKLGIATPTPEPVATDAPTPTPTEQQKNHDKISGFRRRMIIGGGVGTAVVLVGLYLVAFEIPYQKKKME
ncbi:MAG: D-alanyl-D-alanine carboxypeptidase [Lachnospiraceae bacterium]|nr:D-alanyl-D-alanine carboxypeptidase [Lachnospiraceae bacterium]